MARVPVLISVADPTTGNALAGVTATVKHRATASNVTLYAAETGGATVANPLTTDTYGRAFAWADRAPFSIVYSGSGITTYTEHRDVGPSSDRGIDPTLLPYGTIPDLVNSLPGSPADGQIIDYQTAAMAALGIRWRLIYRSASASPYKWECVGGAPLYDQDSFGGSAAISANTWSNAPTAQTTVTLPLAGDYAINAQTQMRMSVLGDGGAGVWIGGATPVSPLTPGVTWPSANAYQMLFCNGVALGVAANATAQLKYIYSAAGTVTVSNSSIFAMPVRVG